MAAQHLYPASDLSVVFAHDNWTTPAYSNINGVAVDDSTFTTRAQVAAAGVYSDGHKMTLTAGVAPSNPATSTVHVRLRRTSASAGSNDQIYVWIFDRVSGWNNSWFVVTDTSVPIDGAYHQFDVTVDLSAFTNFDSLDIALESSNQAAGNNAAWKCSWLNLELTGAPVNWWKLTLPTITAYLISLAQPVDYILPFDIFSGGVLYPSGMTFSWTATTQPSDKGWWMSNGDAFAGNAFVVENSDRPKAPRGYAEVATFATGSTAWCGGFPGPATGFANHLVYAAGGYSVGTDSPTLRIYDGLFDRPIATIPNTSANAVPKAVMSLMTAAGQVFVATYDSGSSSTDWVGRVFALDIESGQMTPMGNPLPTGHLPYALCWHAGRLWCGSHRQSSAASGKVFYIRPGIDTDWTADYDLSSSSVAGCASLCSFQGKLYVGTTAAAGTFAKVLVRDTAGAYTTSVTLSGGTATANNGVPALAEFSGILYATYYNADATVITSIRKYDGSSWSTAYTGSGSTLVPLVGLPTDLTTLLAIGGGVGTAAVLLKTADGTTWTDQSAFLSQGAPSSTGLPAFAVVVH